MTKDDRVETYRCGTCGDGVLVVFSQGPQWEVRCGNGHEYVPTGSEHYLFDIAEVESLSTELQELREALEVVAGSLSGPVSDSQRIGIESIARRALSHQGKQETDDDGHISRDMASRFHQGKHGNVNVGKVPDQGVPGDESVASE